MWPLQPRQPLGTGLLGGSRVASAGGAGAGSRAPGLSRHVGPLQTIREVQPDVVVVELCQYRVSMLKMDETTLLQEAKEISLEKLQQAVRQVRRWAGDLPGSGVAPGPWRERGTPLLGLDTGEQAGDGPAPKQGPDRDPRVCWAGPGGGGRSGVRPRLPAAQAVPPTTSSARSFTPPCAPRGHGRRS